MVKRLGECECRGGVGSCEAERNSIERSNSVGFMKGIGNSIG